VGPTRLGLISTIPSEWATSEETGRGELVSAAGDVRLSGQGNERASGERASGLSGSLIFIY
jgi:hypothetical protein